jgi:hypothetical protein
MRKYKFKIYLFDKKGQLDSVATMTTRKMELKLFENTLRTELMKFKRGTYCFEICDKEASIYIANQWK